MNPSAGWPDAKRSAFNNVTMPARIGADAEVPNDIVKFPPIIVSIHAPDILMSGKPRPARLYPATGSLLVPSTILK
jgi:hypothetical protein